MATAFERAPEVERIARELIAEHHTHLVEARIAYLFRLGDWTQLGQTVAGKGVKLGARERFLVEADFVVIINVGFWRQLAPVHRKALVDHELCHCGRHAEDGPAGSPRWELWPHDIEEFRAVIGRHGLWRPEVEEMAATMAEASRQLPLARAKAANGGDGS